MTGHRRLLVSVLSGWLGLDQTGIDASTWDIARSVLIFLGIPLIARFLSRRLGKRARGRAWYEGTFLPKIGPWALYGLLFIIVILFAPQGDAITSGPLDVAPIAIPLLAYVALMWGGGFGLGAGLGLGYERTTTLAFTGAGNNFELAIAVAIATFGAASGRLWPASSDRSSKYRPSSVLSTPASPCVGDSAPAHPTGHGPTHVPGPVRPTEVRANRAAR